MLTFADGRVKVIDIKGCPDTTAIIKRKLFWFRYPEIDYEWITYSAIDGGFCNYETVKQARKQRKREKEQKKNGKQCNN